MVLVNQQRPTWIQRGRNYNTELCLIAPIIVKNVPLHTAHTITKGHQQRAALGADLLLKIENVSKTHITTVFVRVSFRLF